MFSKHYKVANHSRSTRSNYMAAKRFEVDHPNVMVVRDGVAVFLAPGGVPIWFDHDSVNQIAGVPANSMP